MLRLSMDKVTYFLSAWKCSVYHDKAISFLSPVETENVGHCKDRTLQGKQLLNPSLFATPVKRAEPLITDANTYHQRARL